MSMHPVKPIKPAAPYVGGKRQLAKQIIARIDEVPHTTYAEPFCGMGGVFFRRTQKPKCEVINDLNGEVANFFRIVQRHYGPFMDMLKFMISCRAHFNRLKAADPKALTDLERAARFIYLQRLAFGGKVTGQAFGATAGYPARFDKSKLEPILEAMFTRLSGVIIENLSYKKCITRYDNPTTLFYLDPPYWGTEDYYGKALFSRDDFEKLAVQLAKIKGRFILSLNDTQGVREVFKAFQIEEVEVAYTLSKSSATASREVIIRG